MAGLLQAFLAVVFLGAGLTKLTDYDRFLRTVASIPWMSLNAARRAARTVPVVELALVAAVVALPRVGAVAVLAVLALFTFVIARERAAGREFHCGCFGGAGTEPAGLATIARNAVLGAAAVALLVVPPARPLGAILIGTALGLVFLALEIGRDTLATARAR